MNYVFIFILLEIIFVVFRTQSKPKAPVLYRGFRRLTTCVVLLSQLLRTITTDPLLSSSSESEAKSWAWHEHEISSRGFFFLVYYQPTTSFSSSSMRRIQEQLRSRDWLCILSIAFEDWIEWRITLPTAMVPRWRTLSEANRLLIRPI
jgi:hypothetical protein